MLTRPYDPARDLDAARRIWREVGWLKRDEQIPGLDLFLAASKGYVAGPKEEVECLVLVGPGKLRYLGETLDHAVVSAVTVGWAGRGHGLASRATAEGVAAAAADGAHTAGLGMFEQGFYDRLGFGTVPYSIYRGFDPATLTDRVGKARAPRRLSKDDFREIHDCKLSAATHHGEATLVAPEWTLAEMHLHGGFGFGWEDDDGRLTHHVWVSSEGGSPEHGPYVVMWYAYHSGAELLEILAFLKSVGDQVKLVRIAEPQEIMLQDLIAAPFRQTLVRGGSLEAYTKASSYLQNRILDLPGCLERTKLARGETRFQLALTDPIERYLDDGAPWRGIAGDWVVTLGPSSGAERGVDESLPKLTASVGAFTRLWQGAWRATGLALTDDLAGPRELLEELDEILRLPPPRPIWMY